MYNIQIQEKRQLKDGDDDYFNVILMAHTVPVTKVRPSFKHVPEVREQERETAWVKGPETDFTIKLWNIHNFNSVVRLETVGGQGFEKKYHMLAVKGT